MERQPSVRRIQTVGTRPHVRDRVRVLPTVQTGQQGSRSVGMSGRKK